MYLCAKDIDFVTGTWVQDFVTGNWVQDFVTGSWVQDIATGTWFQDYFFIIEISYLECMFI